MAPSFSTPEPECRSCEFRKYVPQPGHPRVIGLDKTDLETYSNNISSTEHVGAVFEQWKAQLNRPFFGITTDGHRKEGLFSRADEGAPIEAMVTAAREIQAVLSEEELDAVNYDIDSDSWRKWSNPEILIFKYGLRLQTLTTRKIEAILKLVEASLSESGYQKVTAAMEMNHYLGELVNAAPILNRYNYQFALYGTPSTNKPWGFSLAGHHLCIHIFVLGKQMTISPIFLGAEPNEIDEGPHKGLTLCADEGIYGLKLMQTLPQNLQQNAQIYSEMYSDKMPPVGGIHMIRHLGGAFQDNRIIPYEGIKAIDMHFKQQEILLQAIAAFLVLLPPGPFESRMRQIRNALHETYFSWIGGFSDTDAFYYRIQSPVVMVEFDHHSGVFLLNEKPGKYHVHTIVRTPNGGDYGKELLRQFQCGEVSDR